MFFWEKSVADVLKSGFPANENFWISEKPKKDVNELKILVKHLNINIKTEEKIFSFYF